MALRWTTGSAMTAAMSLAHGVHLVVMRDNHPEQSGISCVALM
jgi:hypothetical protein